ncbi:hypothetical protein ACIBVL_34305 [Streptomyces sp. NPDC049687]|uniref:hypothetical protein n=1 Tax=Streptomyces sp. NPDC049687 TaxID=3365596 RepID=UPI0037A8DD12
MRGLPVRRIASTALCATLGLGIAAPAAVAADAARDRGAAASRVTVPGADALLTQTKSLGELGTALIPVTDLLDTVLKADKGRLTPDQATKLGDAAKDAIAKIDAAASVTAASPAADAASHDGKEKRTAADPVADAAAALQAAVANLIAAATSAGVTNVVPAATGVVTSVVDLVLATLSAADLPLPSLPGLQVSTTDLPASSPSLPMASPSLPVASSSVPVSTPSLPAASPAAVPSADLLPAS